MTCICVLLNTDDDILVVDKPPGLRSTREHAADEDNVEAALEKQEGARLWAVHQLDKDTSGVFVLVKHRRLVSEWQKKLAAGSKRYLALVHGEVLLHRQSVDAPIKRSAQARRMVVSKDGKTAVTSLRVLSRARDATAMLCAPRQGRTHQIRVHLAHLGHPLLGEQRYMSPASVAGCRHALHLWQVKIAGRHFIAPIPSDISALAQGHGLQLPEKPPQRT